MTKTAARRKRTHLPIDTTQWQSTAPVFAYQKHEWLLDLVEKQPHIAKLVNAYERKRMEMYVNDCLIQFFPKTSPLRPEIARSMTDALWDARKLLLSIITHLKDWATKEQAAEFEREVHDFLTAAFFKN